MFEFFLCTHLASLTFFFEDLRSYKLGVWDLNLFEKGCLQLLEVRVEINPCQSFLRQIYPAAPPNPECSSSRIQSCRRFSLFHAEDPKTLQFSFFRALEKCSFVVGYCCCLLLQVCSGVFYFRP